MTKKAYLFVFHSLLPVSFLDVCGCLNGSSHWLTDFTVWSNSANELNRAMLEYRCEKCTYIFFIVYS